MKIIKVLVISFILGLSFFTQTRAENNIFGAQQKIDAATVQIAGEDEPGKLLLEYQIEGDKNQSRIFINVSFEEIPANATIIDAFLSLDQEFCAGDTLDITVARVLNSWDKKTITWSDKPGFSTPTKSEKLDCSNEISKWDITEIVKFFYENPEQNFGVVVYGPDEGGTQPYIKTYDQNSENSFILIDYQTESEATPTPSEQQTPQVRKLYIAAIALLVGLIVVIGVIIFLILKKKSKNKTENKSMENNATIAESSEAKTLKLANSQDTEEKKDEA